MATTAGVAHAAADATGGGGAGRLGEAGRGKLVETVMAACAPCAVGSGGGQQAARTLKRQAGGGSLKPGAVRPAGWETPPRLCSPWAPPLVRARPSPTTTSTADTHRFTDGLFARADPPRPPVGPPRPLAGLQRPSERLSAGRLPPTTRNARPAWPACKRLQLSLLAHRCPPLHRHPAGVSGVERSRLCLKG